MELPPGYQRIAHAVGTAVVRDDLVGVPEEVWWGDGRALRGAAGRGQVVVLELAPGVRGVARCYRRGGVMRPLKTRFLSATRAERELVALMALHAAGVSVVEPLAALSRPQGVFHRMRLVTALVEGARPLPAFLADEPALASAVVREAGRVVQTAFDAGLDHPDLHPDNLVVTRQGGALRVVLLDLDRALVRPEVPRRERDRMLLRMARYLERHAGGLRVASRAVDTLRFLAGMGLGRRARRDALARLRPAYERAVVRHRVAWGRL